MSSSDSDQLIKLNNRLSKALLKYQPGGANDSWKQKFLKSLSTIKKMQAAERLVKIAVNTGSDPFGNVVRQARGMKDDRSRQEVCASLIGLDEKVCTMGFGNDKICNGLQGAMSSLRCTRLS